MIKKIMKLIFKEILKKNKDQTLRAIRLNIE